MESENILFTNMFGILTLCSTDYIAERSSISQGARIACVQFVPTFVTSRYGKIKTKQFN
jgi:hypothetical protein